MPARSASEADRQGADSGIEAVRSEEGRDLREVTFLLAMAGRVAAAAMAALGQTTDVLFSTCGDRIGQAANGGTPLKAVSGGSGGKSCAGDDTSTGGNGNGKGNK